jgi:hypothetical protein
MDLCSNCATELPLTSAELELIVLLPDVIDEPLAESEGVSPDVIPDSVDIRALQDADRLNRQCVVDFRALESD